MALAPSTDQCMPARLHMVLIASLHPAATTPDPTPRPQRGPDPTRGGLGDGVQVSLRMIEVDDLDGVREGLSG